MFLFFFRTFIRHEASSRREFTWLLITPTICIRAATAHAAASTVVDVIVSRCQLHSNQPGKGTKGVVYYFEWSSKHYVIKVKTMFIGEHSLPRSIICMSNDSVTSI